MYAMNNWCMWLGFFAFILTLFLMDVFLLGGRKSQRISAKESLTLVVVWVLLALIFNGLIWGYLAYTASVAIANQKALAFFAAYLIEKSLSLDNLFVFMLIFRYFAVPEEYQRRVLLFGTMGAFFMRLVLILFGVFLVEKFHWILYVFGFFLMVTGIKMFTLIHQKPDLNKNFLLKLARKHLRITDKLHGKKFFVRCNGLRYVTPLFLVLILIEGSDIIFAVDSIPAVFSITNDPFIVLTSNVFAVLGLRSLYFLMSNMMNRFVFFKYGLAFILTFIGCKMMLAYWFEIPIFVALAVVILVLLGSVFLSLKEEPRGLL